MKTTVYLVRHAESPHLFGQERTRGLSPEGFAAAKRVAELFTDVDVHYIASSSYTRAVQTVQYIAEQKSRNIVAYDELVERPIKGLDYQVSWDTLLEGIRKSFDDIDFALEGGESTRSALQRSIPVIEKLLKEYCGKNIVIGTHGNIMTVILNHYDNTYGFDFWNSTSKPDIYKLTFDGNLLKQIDRVWK